MLRCSTLQLFSSTDEKHPCPDEKSNSEFSLPKFMIMSCQLLWLYVSTVWLPVLQQPPPGCAECLAEHGVSSKTSLCLHCVTAVSPSVHVLFSDLNTDICKTAVIAIKYMTNCCLAKNLI